MSEIKQFAKFLKSHGIVHKGGVSGGHSALYRGRRRIYTMSNSPKSETQAIENTIKDLIIDGHIPPGVIYRGKTYKKKLML